MTEIKGTVHKLSKGGSFTLRSKGINYEIDWNSRVPIGEQVTVNGKTVVRRKGDDSTPVREIKAASVTVHR